MKNGKLVVPAPLLTFISILPSVYSVHFDGDV